MRKSIVTLCAFLCLCSAAEVNAQIALEYSDTLICPDQTIQMCASLTGQADNNSSDDYYGNVLDLGFTFYFFGKPFTQCIASGNGMIRFDVSNANQSVGWQWSQIVASGDANNAIFATFCDLYLPAGGKIRYQRVGNSGSKRFIVEWCSLPIFGCNSLIVTSQLILYEGSNLIEVHTTKIPPITGSCPSASSGYYGQVVQGVRNDVGTVAYFPTNRDPVTSTTNWGVTGITNDGMRFTPNGTATYLMDSIAYNPWVIIDSLSSLDLEWYAEGNTEVPVATGPCATVAPDRNTDYYTVNFTGNAGCQNALVSFTDTVHINFGSSYDTIYSELCAGSTFNWMGQLIFKGGNYDTLLKTTMGCDSFLRLVVTLNPLPDVTTKGSLKVGICDGSATTLSLKNSATTTTYQWLKDGVAITGATGYQYVVSQAGKYTVVATTNKGCTATSDIFTVTVNPNPTASIKPLAEGQAVICAYDTLALEATVTDAIDYRWAPEKPFRLLTGADGQKVQGVFVDVQTEVVLTVYNYYGCSDSDTLLVSTQPCCEVFVPNAFSPNGDGVNDYFLPYLQAGQTVLNFQVFDRYGKLVYNNENPKLGWDGNYGNSEEAQGGVYMYFVKYTCADGKLYSKKESVTLVR
ncbi:MAG: gliding motility-associated C-terminal domain-containing protein [Edaphocola sp.]